MIIKLLLVASLSLSFFDTYAQHESDRSFAEDFFVVKDSSALVRDWFKLIERRGIVLSYNASKIDLDKKVSVKGKFASEEQLLRRLLCLYDYRLDVSGKNKILIQINGRKKVGLSATVMNKESGEKLYGAAVLLKNQEGKLFVATTNEEGLFSIELPADTYRMEVSYMGFRNYKYAYDLFADSYKSIQMVPLSFPVNEVEVFSTRAHDGLRLDNPAAMLSVGNASLFAQMKMLPGVSGSISNEDFHVNGGQSDENLVLLDGIPIYHTYHTNSFLTPFNGDIIKNISFHDSFFPAQYEGRLSSVTDIQIKDGNKKRHSQTLSLEMPAAAVAFEGPIVNDKLSYLIAGRHSWLDVAEELFADKSRKTQSFYDFNGKLSYDVNERSSIFTSIYRSEDTFHASETRDSKHSALKWDSNLYALGLSTLIGQKVISNTKIAYTNYNNRIYAPDLGLGEPIYIEEGVRRLIAKSDYSVSLDSSVELSGGFKFSREEYKLLNTDESEAYRRQPVVQLSAYNDVKLRISERLVGYAAVNLVGYLPKCNASYLSMQPRFSLRYYADNHHQVFFDFSRMEQFYHNIRISEDLPLPSDFRMPTINGFEPSTSEHVSVGWKHTRAKWSLQSSVYYKRRHHILGLRNQVAWDNRGWNRFITQGNGESYGVKLSAFGNWSRWMGYFSYTYAKSLEWFRENDANKKVDAVYDLPHNLNLAAALKLKYQGTVTVGGYVMSGQLRNVFNNDPESLELVSRSKRGKVNYRLDANFAQTKSWKKNGYLLHYKFGFYNIVGNPREEEVVDLYSVEVKAHCLPYFSVAFKF